MRCPKDGGELIPRIFGKDTGLLICPDCWQNYDQEGRPVENPFKRKQPRLRAHPRSEVVGAEAPGGNRISSYYAW